MTDRNPTRVARGGGPAELDLAAGLARLGYERFRPGQREAIETLLGAGRLLLVAPTGGGKSLTYQLPATVLPGTTIVISGRMVIKVISSSDWWVAPSGPTEIPPWAPAIFTLSSL